MKLDGESAPASLGFAVFDDLLQVWMHIDVTRDSAGEINVFLNATSDTEEPIISFVDTEYSYSERFVIEEVGRGGDRFDNFTVDDAILITPPETTPTDTTTTTTDTTTDGGTPPPIDTTLLLMGAGVTGVVIIVVVVLLKRR
ncbi:MAG: hypothetical protein ACFFDM_13235 [Candidatus Thorarchaeota archaeon]